MNILLIIKGIVTGMAVMIPGVSAGSMIMSMGIYEDLMLLISGRKAEKKSTLPKLIPFVFGVVFGVFLFAFIFKAMLTYYPFQTSCIFIGLILGGIPMIWRNVDRKALSASHWGCFAAAVGVIIVMLVLSRNTSAANSLAPGLITTPLTVVLGFLAASTMIIPGISGSALMLILGYYNEVTDRLTQLASGFATFNWPLVGENVLVFVPFGIGAIIGIVLVARAIRRMLEKFPNGTYMTMVGLMAASPIAVIAKISVDYSAIGLAGYLISAACLVAGFAVSYVLSVRE